MIALSVKIYAMTKTFFIFPILTACWLAILFSCREGNYIKPENAPTAATSTGNPAKNYQVYCAGCHGAKMDDFVGRDWKHGNSVNDLVRGIKHGYPDEGMPGFAEAFSNEEIGELAQYLLEGSKNPETISSDKASGDNIFKSDKLTFRLDTVTTGLDVPWGMAFLPDGALLVTERSGKLYRIKHRKNIEITGVPEVMAQGQGGLLDVALHPDFEQNRLVYLSYSKPKGRQATTAVMRARLEGDKLTGQKVIFEALPYASTRHHYGSRLVFSKNNQLFISVGERGNEDENPQNKDNDLGKIHRINDDGSIPADNPIKDKDGKPSSLYSYGNRNPQGMTIHPGTGELWETEHGPRGGDEINIIKPGKNYGWPVTTYGINYNGTTITDKRTAPGIEPPIHYWTPSIGPSGTAFVTGDRYKPWKGALLVGSLPFGYLSLSYLDGTKITREEKLLEDIGRVRDVRMGPDGYIYVAVEDSDGSIFRLVPVN